MEEQGKIKNQMKKKQIMISGIILIFVIVVVGIIANVVFHKKGKAEKNNTRYSEEYAQIKRDTLLSVDENGELLITRNRVEDSSEGLDDTWTVLVYMTGSDLESNNNAATKVLNDMASAKIKEDNIKNLNLLVETGGANYWASNYGSTDNLHRLKLSGNGEFEEIEKLPMASMGSPDTLADFIEWGVTNYPAKKTMIVFWNHGGPDNDLCYDEIYNDDALTMNEVEYSFAKVKGSLNAPIDVAIFHTCSNGTVEYANTLAPYVDYMIISPTYTPTFGFDYRGLVNQLLKSGKEETTPEKVCDVFLDGFKNYVVGKPLESVGDYALMVYDLSKLDAFLVEYNRICKQVYEMSAVDRKSAKKINKAICKTSQYNMETNFDVACYLDSLEQIVGIDTSKCYSLLKEVVNRYIKCGYINSTCIGMAMYHPVGGMSIQEFNIYRNKAVSPYYLMYLERSAHLMAKRDFDNFKNYEWDKSEFFHEENFDFLNYTEQRYGNKISNDDMYSILTSNSAYALDGFVDSWKDNLNEVPLDERKIFTDIEVALTEDMYTGTITKDSDEINKVYNTIYAMINDNLVCLGENADAQYDEETGKIESNFNGEWLMLGDGQLLTTYYDTILKDYDGDTDTEYIQYKIPVYMDDKESTIYIMKSDDKLQVRYLVHEKKEGINSGYTKALEAGMSFTPIYDVWNEEIGAYTTEYGEEYTYKGDKDFLYTTLEDDEYYYAFVVEDVTGLKRYTKEQSFSIVEEQLTLSSEE